MNLSDEDDNKHFSHPQMKEIIQLQFPEANHPLQHLIHPRYPDYRPNGLRKAITIQN